MFQSDDFDDFISDDHFVKIDEVLEGKSQISKRISEETSLSNDENGATVKRSIPSSVLNLSDSIETPNKAKKRRKFPGPAGLLPENIGDNPSDKLGQVPLSQNFPNSQNLVSNTVFDEAPWLSMLAETKGIENHSIAMVKQKAIQHKLVGRKVSLLAGVVQTIDKTSPDPLLVLRDNSGEIQCTLHRDAWECLCCHLVPHYSVIVLKNSTIFTTGTALKKIYLNITNNNVLSVYCDEENVYSVNNIVKASKSDLTKMYAEEIVSAGDSRVVVLRNLHTDRGTGLKSDGDHISRLPESLSRMLQEDDSCNVSNDDIAQTLLDGITDEFISQEFE